MKSRKRMALCLALACVVVAGCGRESGARAVPAAAEVALAAPPVALVVKPVVDHQYQAVDGVEYSYTGQLSDDARKAG